MIIGRLGQDPDLRHTKSNKAVCNLSVATSSRYKDSNNEWQEETEWHRITVWGSQAENCDKYLQKGSQVFVEGNIKTREWEDKDGNKRYTTEIHAYNVTFLSGQGDGSGGQGQPQGSPDNKPMDSTVELDEDFDDLDDDLPF